ncbi:MAG TPA: nickel insertion protein [Chthonomonas sp.]|uniref:nickel insertion protein n=1 Tax=Chthonomonas sp. TaxID=2282153 RepID=UPI002B4B8DD5|nr:nickel insertion protein [Chthonomonas sp.]HLI48210.1 nickel insertion protein [Chthonomonas sp.]
MSQALRYCLLFIGDDLARGAEEAKLVGSWVEETFQTHGWELVEQQVVPDNPVQIAETLRRWSDGRCELLLTMGGTGFSPRASAPEATRQVIQREAPGLMECIRLWGAMQAPSLLLSRGLAGLRNRVLIVNLPLALDEVQASLGVLMPLLPRAIAELRDEPTPPLSREAFPFLIAAEQRAVSVETEEETPQRVVVLETNLDDFSPELYEPLMERLFAAGALDVYLTPIHMKKGRPATLLTVLGPAEIRETLAEIIFTETTTFGIRHTLMERYVLARRWESVETPYGPIRIKIGSWRGIERTASPEYEDVKAAALAHSVPLKQVYLAAQLAYAALQSQRGMPS